MHDATGGAGLSFVKLTVCRVCLELRPPPHFSSFLPEKLKSFNFKGLIASFQSLATRSIDCNRGHSLRNAKRSHGLIAFLACKTMLAVPITLTDASAPNWVDRARYNSTFRRACRWGFSRRNQHHVKKQNTMLFGLRHFRGKAENIQMWFPSFRLIDWNATDKSHGHKCTPSICTALFIGLQSSRTCLMEGWNNLAMNMDTVWREKGRLQQLIRAN